MFFINPLPQSSLIRGPDQLRNLSIYETLFRVLSALAAASTSHILLVRRGPRLPAVQPGFWISESANDLPRVSSIL